MDQPDITDLLESWLLHLAAEGKTEATRNVYRDGITSYLRWCTRHEHTPTLAKPQVNAWIANLLDRGLARATVRARQQAARRFAAWAAHEGETERNELAGLTLVPLERKVVADLSADELAAMLQACAGKELRDRRDEAILRLMAETGMRAGETAALRTGDVDLRGGTAVVRRGKGGAGRVVPFGPRTARALDRWLRARRAHRMAHTDRLWLGERGREFGYDGLHAALRRRAELAGVQGFHPHRLRHTAATRWLAAGGSENGLMAVCGWTRHDMLDRYTAASSQRRAAEEARRLGLGDL